MIKKHWPIILFALLAGLLVVWPTVFSIYKIGWENWRGIYPLFSDDEVHYLAMTREVADGHWGLGNVFLAEHKNEPFLQPPLAEWFFAGLSRASGISIPGIFTIADFILVFIGALVSYWLFFSVAQSRVAAFGATAFFYLVFLYIFNRPINPQFSFLWLVLGLGMIWRLANIENSFKDILKNNLWLVLFFGILFYIYPYYWTALIIVYGLILLFKMRDWGLRASLKSGAIFLVGAAFVSLPYLLNQARALASPFYGETVLRLGLLNIHWPGAFVNVGLLILTLASLVWLKDKLNRPQYNFAFALIFGGIILNWQNIITGKYLQFSSHYYQSTVLFVILVLVMLITEIWRQGFNYKEKKTAVFLTAAIIILIVIIQKQAGEIKTFFSLLRGAEKQEMMSFQETAEVFDWFNKNTHKDSVIMSFSDKYSSLLPIYTANNLYGYGYAGCYLMSDEEIIERWARKNVFREIDRQAALEGQREIWLNRFIDKYQNKIVRVKILIRLGIKKEESELISREFVDRIIAAAADAKNQNKEAALKKFRLEYILVDENDKAREEIAKLPFVAEAAKINGTVIYRVN